MKTTLDAPPELLDDQEKNVVAQIRKHGWFSHNVFAEPGHKGFHYTTGFCVNAAFPELLIFSLKFSHDIFWDIFNELKAGRTFPIGRPIPDILGNVDVMLLPISTRQYRDYLGWNRWFYRGDNFSCLQLVYPDRANVFPWQPKFDAAWRDRQDDLTNGDWGRSDREA